MDFRSFSVGTKVRIIVFFLVAGYLVFGGAASVKAFRDLQLDRLAKNTIDTDVTVDETDFSLFFIAGEGLLDSIVIFFSGIGYALGMLLLSVVSAVLLRTIGLRRKWNIDPAEHKFCTIGYLALAAVGLIVSLILTKFRLLLAVVLFELPSVAVMWLIYLTELERRSRNPKQGHFVDGTEQELTDL